MSWPAADARELGNASEIEVIVPAAGRPAMRTPIRIVAVDDNLYIRSRKGENGRWHRPPTATTVRLGRA